MPRLLRVLLIVLASGVTVAIPAAAQTPGGGPAPAPQPTPPPAPPPPTPKLVVERPVKKTLIREGQGGRYMLDGTWYFRQDDAFVGDSHRYFSQKSLQGWTKIRVPHNWNARDTTLNKPTVGWYRYEFRLPKGQGSKRLQWKLLFESVNHRATVYLNGKKVGLHAPGFLPFEVDLAGIKRGKRNRLVVKVSTLRGKTDLTHWRAAAFNGFGSGGWWNFGGISREVYLRRFEGIDVERVRTTPSIRCVKCSAKVTVRVRLRNVTDDKRKATVNLFLRLPGSKRSRSIDVSRTELDPHSIHEVTRRFTIRKPRLWQPGRPALYGLSASAVSEGKRVASYSLSFGVKSVKTTPDGQLLLNGHRLEARGVSIHEDDPTTGAALTSKQRRRLLHLTRSLHATVVRSQYPLHPALVEAFDRAGILYWSGAPVYQVPVESMAIPSVRANAIRVNRETVLDLENHASVFVWSIANELPDEGNPAQSAFIAQASDQVRHLDPSRLVGLARQSQLGQKDPIPAIQSKIDVIGVNDYFGWYNASLIPNRPSTNADLGPFLDFVHQVYPGKPLFITEYGAESSRHGAPTEKGTFEFQTAWMTDHLNQLKTRPWVGGAIAWILKDFRVVPDWAGGSPTPTPPWNNKGLVDETGGIKPAYVAMQNLWRRTKQLH
jgi:beta-glucuronidase